MRTAIIPLVFGFVLALPTTPGRCQTDDGAAASGALRQGTLPNGVRYVVLPHSSPTGDLSLRLIVDAGSLDEADDERGFAHFVEHMAFNGTRNLPPGTLRYFFQQLGLSAGSHLNAATTYANTIYHLNLTAQRRDRFEDCLIVLRDYADGVLFQPEEVKQESGVILSELRSRDSMDARIGHEIMASLFEGTRLPERIPIGLAEQIETATAEQLKAYYRRNYVPSRMTVVAVGDIDPDQVIEQIESAFSSMEAPADAAARIAVKAPPEPENMRAHVVATPAGTGAQFQLGNLITRPADTEEGRRLELAQRLAMAILDTRLRQRRDAAAFRYGSARAYYDVLPFGSLVHCRVAVGTAADEWSVAVELAETELRRAQQLGFTQAEVDEAVSHQMGSLRTMATDFANFPASRVADDLVRALTAGRAWRPVDQTVAEATAALRELTPDEVTKALVEMLVSESSHALLLAPTESRARPERVLAAYEKSASRSLRKRGEKSDELVFRYQDFGTAGTIARRDQVDDLNLTRVTFANGVRLNLRPSEFEPERFRLRIEFTKNYSSIKRDHGGLIELAGHLFTNSSLRRHKPSEVARLLALHAIRMDFAVNSGTPVLTMSGPSEELPFALQLLTALFSDLRYQDDSYRSALSRYAGQQRRTFSQVTSQAMHDALYAFTVNDRRVLLLHPKQYASEAARTETERWLREHIIDGPLEIGLVGDFDAEAAVTTACATVGTLARRRPPPKPGPPLAMKPAASRHEFKSEIVGTASGSCIIWPVDLPDDARQEATLEVAVNVLSERLVLALREGVGAAYSPRVRLHRDRIQRDFAFISATNTFERTRALQMTEGTIRLAARTAESGIQADEFARAIEPARTRCREQLRSNSWWLESVAVAQSRPAALEAACRQEAVYAEISLEDVNAMLARLFKPDRVTAMVVNPAEKQPGVK
jgi:zinc protease